MRLVSSLPAVGALLLLAACSAPSFTTEVRGEAVVPGDPAPSSPLLNSLPSIGSFTNLDFNQDQEFKNQGVSKDEVSSVKVDRLQLRVVSPPGQDLAFLDEVRFYAKAGDQEVLIAGASGLAELGAGRQVLELGVRGVELQPFVTAPSMSILLRGRGRVPAQDVRLQAVVTFDVEVNVL
jgi:hypothetical protein